MPVEAEGAEEIGNSQNEGMLLPQPVPFGGGGGLCQSVEGWKHITNDPYVLSIVARGADFVLRVHPFCSRPHGNKISPGAQKIQGMPKQISLMLQKNAITEVPPDTPGFYSNVFLVRKVSGGSASSYRLKITEHPHLCTSLS